jgi:hypothetical protein
MELQLHHHTRFSEDVDDAQARDHAQSATEVIVIEENYDDCLQPHDRPSNMVTQNQHAPGPSTRRKHQSKRGVNDRSLKRVSLGLKHYDACLLTIKSMT